MAEPPPSLKLVTIGVYGFSQETFFARLRNEHVDTFCDVRYRRGVRGSQYAFANRARLEQRLGELGIRYLHFRELAPSPALRRRQAEADQQAGTPKRQRTALGEQFIAGYCEEYLAALNSREFVEKLGKTARVAALFCVEREPAACHRSLLAARLQQDLGVELVHLLPDQTAPEIPPPR